MKLTEAEWQLMNALWENHPASARQIMGRLPEGVRWAYTTVKTMLSRLVDKDVVAEQKQGNISLYTPLVTRRKARSNAFKSFLDQAFDGALGPLMHFMLEERKLSEKEMDEIVTVLQGKNKDKEE